MAKDNHIDIDQLKKFALRVKQELIKSGHSVPTKLSELINDAEFQTKEEVEALIAAANRLTRRVVDSIDDIDLMADDADQYIYMVKYVGPSEEEGGEDNIWYDEYMIIDGKLDPLGNTKVDLSDYVKYSDRATDEQIEKMLLEVFGDVDEKEL